MGDDIPAPVAPVLQELFKENEEKLKFVPTLIKPLPEEEEAVRSRSPIQPDVSIPYYKNKYLEAKKEFIANPDAKFSELAQRYDIPIQRLIVLAKQDNWEGQRVTVAAKASEKSLALLEESLADLNTRHLAYLRATQKVAVKAIKRLMKNSKELKPRDTLSFLIESVKLEREIRGVAKSQPKIVNIITNQQAIIQKYKQKEAGEIVEEDDGRSESDLDA